MNPYLLFLVIFGVLSTPLRLSVRIRLGRRTSYLFRLQMIGLPFYRSRKEEDPGDEMPIDQEKMAKQLTPANLKYLRALLTRPVLRQIRQIFHLEWLSLYAHISQEDAMQTALLYGGLRSAADALGHGLGHRLPIHVHLRADYQGLGSEALLRCIVTLRLGSLFPAALAWLWQLRKQHPSKEVKHAAASH